MSHGGTATDRLTGPALFAALEQVVADVGPRHRYPDDMPGAITSGGTCRYVHPETGQPLCLYGKAFAKVGALEAISPHDVSSIQELLIDWFGFDVLDPWVEVFQYGQDVQDSLAYWSTAVKGMRERAVKAGLLDA